MTKAKKDDKEEPKILESFLESIPLFGNFFKEIGKTEVFKKRFEEVNKKIQENLQKGEKRRWGFEAHISTRPIIREAKEKKEEAEIFIGKGYLYLKKERILVLAVKVPRENIQIRIEANKLVLKDNKWEKIINLPDRYRNIKEKKYKKNILALKLTR